MSKKRGMSKKQRLYYEYQNKDKIKEQLVEISKDIKDLEAKSTRPASFNPHQNSYYN
jgi:hypothetical protein